jgi:hypothetical protein
MLLEYVKVMIFNNVPYFIPINKGQYFEGITEEIWQYKIGGYRVCDKWLKDRKGRRLSLEDIKHYCKVVTAIKNTIEI